MLSDRTTATSVNLQKACRDMVFIDPPINVNTMLQAIGRVFRIGQKHPQNIWILTADETYDQVKQHRAATKIISQIAGQGDIHVTDQEIQDYL